MPVSETNIINSCDSIKNEACFLEQAAENRRYEDIVAHLQHINTHLLNIYAQLRDIDEPLSEAGFRKCKADIDNALHEYAPAMVARAPSRTKRLPNSYAKPNARRAKERKAKHDNITGNNDGHGEDAAPGNDASAATGTADTLSAGRHSD